MSPSTRPVERTIALALMIGSGVACTAILGLTDKPLVASDGGARDGGADAALSCTADPTGYNAMTTAACWTTYDVTDAVGAIPGASGGTFDGRYVYFAPSGPGSIFRYDTTAAFDATASWSAFDPSKQGGDAAAYSDSYAGAIFDGQYVYFVPGDTVPAFLRYDTKAPFTSEGSWTLMTLTPANAGGYSGGAFDGRYVYFAPFDTPDETTGGVVARYDTQSKAFTNEATGWSVFDTTTLPNAAGDFYGAVFDGQHVYFIPNASTGGSSILAVYDTSQTFSSASGWTTLDLSTLDQTAMNGYESGAFDGKNLYLAPSLNDVALRYTVADALSAPPSWSRLLTQGIAEQPKADQVFGTSAYDGRFIYFVPGYDSNASTPKPNGGLVRYDTTEPTFADAGSWSAFDTTKLPGSPADFSAAVFDGKYLYIAPSVSSIVARFEAKATTAQPTLGGWYHGSFY
jgi:hypothetical protein